MGFVESGPALFGYTFLTQLPANFILVLPETFEFAYGSKEGLGIEAYSVLVFLCVRFF
jgi:hypothetical protein